MQKNAMTITLSTLVMGIFGAFLRWLQNVGIYEQDTGLAIRGAGISAAVLIFTLLVLALQIGIACFWLRETNRLQSAEEAFHTDRILPILLGWLCCAVYAVGGIMLMFSAGSTAMPVMQRLLGAFAIVAGVCFPFLPSRIKYEGASQLGKQVTSSLLSLFFCFWLVYSYRSGAQVPSLWTYAPEIVALSAGALAFYYVCGWCFGRVRPKISLIMLQFAAFLCIAVLPDDRNRAVTLLLIAAAAMLLMLEYLFVNNLLRTEPAPAEE